MCDEPYDEGVQIAYCDVGAERLRAGGDDLVNARGHQQCDELEPHASDLTAVAHRSQPAEPRPRWLNQSIIREPAWAL